MKRSTQLAELNTQVKHNTLHKVTARGGKGSKMVANRTKQSLRKTWVKTTQSIDVTYNKGLNNRHPNRLPPPGIHVHSTKSQSQTGIGECFAFEFVQRLPIKK